jgi:tetratricopeptide (TPR) repeat protein
MNLFRRTTFAAIAMWLTIGASSKVKSQTETGPQVNVKGDRAATEAFAAKWRLLEPYHKEAKAALASHKWEVAESACLKALAIVKEDPISWLTLADASEQLGKNAQALKAYQALVYSQGWSSSINSDPTTLMRYVLALSRTGGRWDEAVAVFNKMQKNASGEGGVGKIDVEFDARRPDWTRMKAVAHYMLGTRSPHHAHADPGEQLKHLETATRLRPKWSAVQTAYGQALEKAGRTAEAKAAFRRAASR